MNPKIEHHNPSFSHLHDDLFRGFFSHSASAKALLRKALNHHLLEQKYDWSTLRLEKDVFVNAGLPKARADLVYSVKSNSKIGRISTYLLLEHKSYLPPKIMAQLAKYFFFLSLRNPDAIVIGMVFHHVNQHHRYMPEWRFQQLRQTDPQMYQAVATLNLDIQVLMVNLHHLKLNTLPKSIRPIVYLLREIRQLPRKGATDERIVREFFCLCADLDKKQMEWCHLHGVYYIRRWNPDITMEMFMSIASEISPEITEMIEIKELIRMEGVREGKQIGEHKVRTDIAQGMMNRNFDTAVIFDILEITPDELQEMLNKSNAND